MPPRKIINDSDRLPIPAFRDTRRLHPLAAGRRLSRRIYGTFCRGSACEFICLPIILAIAPAQLVMISARKHSLFLKNTAEIHVHRRVARIDGAGSRPQSSAYGGGRDPVKLAILRKPENFRGVLRRLAKHATDKASIKVTALKGPIANEFFVKRNTRTNPLNNELVQTSPYTSHRRLPCIIMDDELCQK